MFARRVFELLASNTLVVSNFSRGLRLMFGDLVVATDSGTQMRRRLEQIEAHSNGNERMRAMALRKVLREHTYAERLSFVAQHAGVTLPRAEVERPLLIVPHAPGRDEEAVRGLLASWTRQSWIDWVLAVLVEDDADAAAVEAAADDDRVVAVQSADGLAALARSRGCGSSARSQQPRLTTKVSSPRPPSTVSLPAPPSITSWLAPPSRMLSRALPVIVFAASLPVPRIAEPSSGTCW